MAEAQRLIGDNFMYNESVTAMSSEANGTWTLCKQEQAKIESQQYLANSSVVYGYYKNITPNISDSSTLVDYVLFLASGKDRNVLSALSSVSCPTNFPK
jgi:hypothetical protein